MQISDDVVRVAADVIEHKLFGEPADDLFDVASAALTAALAAMWRPISEAPDNRPAMYGYRTKSNEWYQRTFDHPSIPKTCGYTHYAELLPSPPSTSKEDGK